MEELLRDKSCAEFTAALASKAAVPGGGGASALVGALGAALGGMVGQLTVGKQKYASVEADVRALMDRAQTLQQRLLACIDADAAAFEPLSRAYAIPKDDPTREAVMEVCLRRAADVPLEILTLSCEVVALQRGFADMGSVLAVSDAATGAALCRAALQGAAVNVKVNTKAMKDRAYAGRIDARVDALVAEYAPLAQQIYDDVYGRFC